MPSSGAAIGKGAHRHHAGMRLAGRVGEHQAAGGVARQRQGLFGGDL
jgi:hypothetical protein